MSTENSKQIVRNFYEGFSTHDFQRIFDDYISEELVIHSMGTTMNKQAWLDYEKTALVAMPDLKVTVLDQIAEDNKVFTHWLYQGTHTNVFFDKPASGNPINFEAISVDVVENGKIVKHHVVADTTQLMQQFDKKQEN